MPESKIPIGARFSATGPKIAKLRPRNDSLAQMLRGCYVRGWSIQTTPERPSHSTRAPINTLREKNTSVHAASNRLSAACTVNVGEQAISPLQSSFQRGMNQCIPLLPPVAPCDCALHPQSAPKAPVLRLQVVPTLSE